jgi:hypothetical protein
VLRRGGDGERVERRSARRLAARRERTSCGDAVQKQALNRVRATPCGVDFAASGAFLPSPHLSRPPARPFSGPSYALPSLRLSRPRSPLHPPPPPPPRIRRRRRPRCRSRSATSTHLLRPRCRRPPVPLATPPWACIVCATVHDARVPTVRAMHAPRLTSLTSTSSLSPVLQPVSGLVIGPGLVHATTKSIASSFRPGLVHAH